ncbi:2-oxo acid dehydrogenase subunit E2 [Rhizobium rhizogenes]|uniref:2-oxo acid dehydrogenase subunit E2 n=1 Tax=Rhizobium rhizogenes TaxID=359 RepID=UPI001F34B802|nr:2-oxo acid dehydrogenase subunit E2 [Rhizobium rhizogenes]
MPRLNSSDDSCTLVKWSYESGSNVRAGQVLFVAETSKATTEVEAEVDGILEVVQKAGSECSVGATLGYLLDKETERSQSIISSVEEQRVEQVDIVITQGARDLMRKWNLTEADVRAVNKTVIRQADLLEFYKAPPAEAGIPLSSHQCEVARTVTQSHETIPTAFLLMRVECDAALQRVKAASRREGVPIGLAELLIKLVAELPDRFPFFFGSLLATNRFMPAINPGIGLTVDIGKGLFIPVIKIAGTKSLQQIAKETLKFKVKSASKGFTHEDLEGGDITISLNNDRDTVLSLPMVLPNQTCIISLSAALSELAISEDGSLTTKHFVHIGVSYDHRVINGHDAGRFLQAIKSSLEEPTSSS